MFNKKIYPTIQLCHEKMLKRYKVDMNGERKSPLLYALRQNNEEIVKFIIAQGQCQNNSILIPIFSNFYINIKLFTFLHIL